MVGIAAHRRWAGSRTIDIYPRYLLSVVYKIKIRRVYTMKFIRTTIQGNPFLPQLVPKSSPSDQTRTIQRFELNCLRGSRVAFHHLRRITTRSRDTPCILCITLHCLALSRIGFREHDRRHDRGSISSRSRQYAEPGVIPLPAATKVTVIQLPSADDESRHHRGYG